MQSCAVNSKRVMETRDHGLQSVAEVKNGASPKSQMSRGNFLIYFLVVALIVATAFTSCKRDKGDENELPKYILIDENLGDQVDIAILGLDGDGYFFKFQDENQNIPQRFIIYDGKNDNIEMIVNFG